MRTVVVVAFEGVQSLDVTGPAEVLARGAELAGDPCSVVLATATGGPVRSSPSGLALLADAAIERIRGPVDTLVVAGGDGTPAAVADERLVRGIRRLAARARRTTSVCTGAFLLAEAGLLDGRRATTHWASTGLLARRHPAVAVEPDAVYVRDGDVWTSAGVTAGMDLALALVEEDHGREVALEVARRMVVYLQRPGGQSQFSAALRAQAAERAPLREVQTWAAEHLDADLSVPALARRAAMSTRSFARAFSAEVGVPPGRHVEDLRLEAARRLLETTGRPIAEVAAACGFGTPETLRRTFVRRLNVAPADYRRRFRKEPA